MVLAIDVAVAIGASAPPVKGAPTAKHAAAHPRPAAADTAAVARMNVAQAQLAATRGEIILVDVRVPGQRALGHVRGDAWLPDEQVAAHLGDLPKSKKLVFYCSCPAEELALDAARSAIGMGRTNVAVLVGGFDAWRTAGGAVAEDAPWEQVFHVADSPAGWGKTPIDSVRCRYAVDDSVGFHSRASGCIRCAADPNAHGFAGLQQKVDATALRGRKVTFTAMVRARDVHEMAFLWIAAEDQDGRIMALTPPDADPIAGTADWRQSAVSAVVPPDAVRLMVGVSLATAGRLWIDDARLVAEEDPGLPRLRIVLQNHGFED